MSRWGRWPILQIALDQTELKEAVRVAKRVAKLSGIWLEAGTPLIKSEGIKSVAKLRKLFPQQFIVADMKPFDAGWVEAELAAKAGASLVTVLGAAGRETVEDVVEACGRFGVKVCVDLMGVDDPVRVAAEAEEAGADLILLHAGFTHQKRGITASNILRLVEETVENVGIPVGVAGGIRHGEAGRFVRIGCKVVVVGSAITKASDPADAAKTLLEEITSP